MFAGKTKQRLTFLYTATQLFLNTGLTTFHNIHGYFTRVMPDPPGGGGLPPYKRLIGMSRWMGSHFHDWSDYNGVAFLIDLLEWGRKFTDFLANERILG